MSASKAIERIKILEAEKHNKMIARHSMIRMNQDVFDIDEELSEIEDCIKKHTADLHEEMRKNSREVR